jgi:glutathione S-transferase
MTIQFSKEEQEEIWKGFQTTLHTLADTFAGREVDGWCLGERISFADFALAGGLTWIRALYGEESQIWHDVSDCDNGKWGRFMEKLAKYQTELY